MAKEVFELFFGCVKVWRSPWSGGGWGLWGTGTVVVGPVYCGHFRDSSYLSLSTWLPPRLNAEAQLSGYSQNQNHIEKVSLKNKKKHFRHSSASPSPLPGSVYCIVHTVLCCTKCSVLYSVYCTALYSVLHTVLWVVKCSHRV